MSQARNSCPGEKRSPIGSFSPPKARFAPLPSCRRRLVCRLTRPQRPRENSDPLPSTRPQYSAAAKRRQQPPTSRPPSAEKVRSEQCLVSYFFFIGRIGFWALAPETEPSVLWAA